MNRALVLGIAIFLAVVGIALLGGDNAAVAGHGCHGCNGCGGCDGCFGCNGGCFGCHGCRGGLLRGLFRGCHGCHGCHGNNDCCGEVVEDACGCHGGAAAEEAAPTEAEVDEAAPPAPEGADASRKRAPFGFRQVHFTR
jgi:hypothetical protein